MTVRVTEAGTLGALAPAWDALVDAQPLPSPFLRSWWLAATAAGAPAFVLAVDGDALVGGLALQRERRRGLPVLAFMGSGPLAPDHLDLVAAPGREGEVAAAVGAWLRGRAQVLDLKGASETAAVAAVLPGRPRRSLVEPAPFAVLAGTYDDYFGGRPSRMRTAVRSAARRLEASGFSHRVTGADGIDGALASLRALHAGRWDRATNFLRGFDRFAEAARAGAARGELVVHEVSDGEAVVASLAVFEVAGRSSYYQSGRSTDREHRDAGSLLLARAIERAYDLGHREFDFLRGDEPYKRKWTNGSRRVDRWIAGSGVAGRAGAAALAAGVRGRRRAAALARRVRR